MASHSAAHPPQIPQQGGLFEVEGNISDGDEPDVHNAHEPEPVPPTADAAGGAPASTVPARNLVVSQLPRSIDTSMLRAIFSEFGELITALVMMDVQSGRSRGFGFVWFKHPEDGKRAMEAMNGKVLDEGGKPLKVFASEHPDGLSEAASIDVLNFPSSIARTSGRDLFSKFGKLVRYEVSPHEGRASGSGGSVSYTTTVTVEYETILEARAAVNALHGVRMLAFDNVNLNLHLPLVTKYLIEGARRATNSNSASRTSALGRSRHTPGNSGTASNRYFSASGSQSQSAYRGSGHSAHLFAAPGMPMMQGPMMIATPPYTMSPSGSGVSNPMAMSAGQQVYYFAPPMSAPVQNPSPNNRQGQSVFSLGQPAPPNFGPPPGAQPGGMFAVPPGYMMVPVQMQAPPPPPPPPQGDQQQMYFFANQGPAMMPMAQPAPQQPGMWIYQQRTE
jgi:hypothetical protein